ncbi:TniB family NTP-binding protein [Nocardia fluminea]
MSNPPPRVTGCRTNLLGRGTRSPNRPDWSRFRRGRPPSRSRDGSTRRSASEFDLGSVTVCLHEALTESASGGGAGGSQAVGIRDAYLAIRSDDQLEHRFAPLALPRWDPVEEACALLASFAAALPLRRPSPIADREMAGYS